MACKRVRVRALASAHGCGSVMAPSSARNRQARLASEYHELGRQLTSGKLTVVGNYTLQRTIGQGTYGRVRLATHRLTNSRVAVKQIPKEHVANLTREIHHHRRLHHPHVLQLFEVIQTESHIWMILELCAGGELYDYIIERGKLSESEARSMFGQICLGVAYIHDQGIVHRDLKLENILLDEHHNIKLSDFGFTREYQGHQLLQTKCGTIAYSAPEVLAGMRYVGPEIDVWSMGIILYVLLCGYLPFDDENDFMMQWKIMHEEADIPATLSDEARDLLASMLQKDGSRRLTIREILSHPWFRACTTNYLDMLSSPRPALFTSSVEKDLFMNLQDLGFAVGQIQHSVATFACDTAGAFWWLLLRKRIRKSDVTQSTSRNSSPVPPCPTLGLALSPLSSTEFESRVPVQNPSPQLPLYQRVPDHGTANLSHEQNASSTDALSLLAPVAAPQGDPFAPSSTVRQPFLPAKSGLREKQLSMSQSTPMLHRMSSVSSRASTTEHIGHPMLRSYSRRLSSRSLESFPLTSSGHLRRQVSSISSHMTRRRRGSESTVIKHRLPIPRPRTTNQSLSHTPTSRVGCERPVSLDEQALYDIHQQLNSFSLSRASTPPNGTSLAFMRGSRSAFGINMRPIPSPEPRTRLPLPHKDQRVDAASLQKIKKSFLSSDDDDWIDEDEFLGGLGQLGSLAAEVPLHQTRRGSPCPPRMQLPRSASNDKKTSTFENTKSMRQKMQRDLQTPLIEEDEEL